MGIWNNGVSIMYLVIFSQFFFIFRFSCEIMSDNGESKSRLRIGYGKTCVKFLDVALIVTIFVCLA